MEKKVMHAKTARRALKPLVLELIGALACCVMASAHAGTATKEKPAYRVSASSAAQNQRYALDEDEELVDCDEEDEDEIDEAPARAAPHRSAARSAPAKAAAPVKAKPTWEVLPADKTLKATLARWAAAEQWQLVWELPVDYPVDARSAVVGSFEEAVSMVAKSMNHADVPMKAIFYAGNRVLRIVAKGDE
jgi:hypothetical protein